MPIEDADKVHSRGSKEEGKINILGFKIGFITLVIGIGVLIAIAFMGVGGYMMMSPQPQIPTNASTTQINPTDIINDINIAFDVVTTNYNYHVIQMKYSGNKSILNFPSNLSVSMYSPPSPHYVQRQAINSSNIIFFDSKQYNTIYIYTGLDNTFYMSYTLPKYSECVDFINGEWGLNMDDNITKRNMYKYTFNITNSKTYIIDNGMSINDSLKTTPDYSTFFIYSGTYKERLSLIRSSRLIGLNNPSLDAGGSGSNIVIHSNNNVISGLTLTNSGNKETFDGGISILPGSSGNIITKNTIYKTIHGILIYNSNENIINNNTIRNNDKTGITLLGSRSNIITKNIIYNNIDGIRLDSKSDINIIKENNLYDNKGYGVIIDNYPNLDNVCEYNNYKNNKMLCSDSIDRDQTSATIQITKPTTTYTTSTTSDDWWENCKGDPKCY